MSGIWKCSQMTLISKNNYKPFLMCIYQETMIMFILLYINMIIILKCNYIPSFVLYYFPPRLMVGVTIKGV
jgi:hypothetical protein